MAQLTTTKEKYGVSVAARIDTDMAHQIAERAERLGVSFAKMVSMIISRGFNPSEPVYIENDEEVTRLENEVGELTYEISELRDELGNLRRLYQLAAARFIEELAENKEQQVQFATNYNEVLQQVKEELQ
jgi:archaellum component FlaC